MSKLKGLIAYLLVRLFGLLPLALARGLGAAVGRLIWLAKTQQVLVTQRNIHLCLPELSAVEQAALAKSSIIETGKLAFESAVVWRLGAQQLDQFIVKISGLDHVKTLQAEHKGLLILGPHLGNWEVLGRYITCLGKVVSMFQPPKMAKLGELIRHCRESSGAHLVATDRRGLTAVLSALKKGHISGVLPDQTPKDEVSGIFAPFFNTPAFTMTLAQRLAQHANCKVVFAYAKRVSSGFEIVFVPAPDEIYSADTSIAVSALNAGVERCVRAVPEQYQWEYKRFKKMPDGKNIYEY